MSLVTEPSQTRSVSLQAGNEKRNRIGPGSLRTTRISKIVLNPSFGEFFRQLDSKHGRVFRIRSRLPHNQGLLSLATILKKDRRIVRGNKVIRRILPHPWHHFRTCFVKGLKLFSACLTWLTKTKGMSSIVYVGQPRAQQLRIEAGLSGNRCGTKQTGRLSQQEVLTLGLGQIRVELMDEDDQPLPGYALEECLPVSGDDTDLQVHWKDKNDLSGAVGKTVRLRFELKNARLYSYRRMN